MQLRSSFALHFKFCLLLMCFFFPFCKCWSELRRVLFGNDVIDLKYSSQNKYLAVAKKHMIQVYDGNKLGLLGTAPFKENCKFLSFDFSMSQESIFYTCLDSSHNLTIYYGSLLKFSQQQYIYPQVQFTHPTDLVTTFASCFCADDKSVIYTFQYENKQHVHILGKLGNQIRTDQVKNRTSNITFSLLTLLPSENAFVGFDNKIRFFKILRTQTTQNNSTLYSFTYFPIKQTEVNQTISQLHFNDYGNMLFWTQGSKVNVQIQSMNPPFGSGNIQIKNMKGNYIKKTVIHKRGRVALSTDTGFIYLLNQIKNQKPFEISSSSTNFAYNFDRKNLLYFDDPQTIVQIAKCNNGSYVGYNDTCSGCYQRCQTCNHRNSDACESCYPSFYLSNESTCERCEIGCIKCTNSRGCEECQPNYSLQYDQYYNQKICKQKRDKNKQLTIAIIIVSIALLIAIVLLIATIIQLRKNKKIINDMHFKSSKIDTAVNIEPRVQTEI